MYSNSNIGKISIIKLDPPNVKLVLYFVLLKILLVAYHFISYCYIFCMICMKEVIRGKQIRFYNRQLQFCDAIC